MEQRNRKIHSTRQDVSFQRLHYFPSCILKDGTVVLTNEWRLSLLLLGKDDQYTSDGFEQLPRQTL
jgi:hypothetical protein